MQGKLNKKEIITIISIAVLLIIAIIGTVVFLKNRGTTEAIELSAQQQNQEQRQTSNSDTQTSISQDNQPNIAQENVQQEQQSEAIQPSDDTTQTGNTGDAGATDGTTIPTTGATTITSTGTTTSTSGIAIGNSQQNAEVDSIQETTITREEEGEERKVSDDRKVRWQPMALNSDIASARINAEKANIKIEKTAKTQTGENLVTAGENITYTLKVTNTGDKDVKQIDVTDKIGKNIIYVETDDNAERIKNENGEIIALRWKIDLKAKESVELTFEVQVKDEAEGTILNKAIANGEESEEVKTSIIKSEKTSILKRKCIEIEEPAEIGDEITYTISVKNTGEVSGKTIIKDDNLKSILEDGKATLVGDIKLYEGDVLKLSNITDKELIAGLKDINIPANNGEIKVVFTVKINKINGEIVNIGKIGKQEKPTNPERIETLNIDIQKEIKEIRRNNQVVSAPAMVDDIIYYNIKVKNTGSVDKEIQVSDIIENNKEELDLYYNNQVVTKIMLAKGEEKILTATYLVKQSDIDNQNETNNKINNIGKIKYNDTEKTDNAETLLVEKEPLIEVEKTATKINGNTVTKEEDGKLISTDEEGNVISRDTKVAKGDMITYTIKTTNTGKVTLKNIDVTDTLEITYNGNKIAPNTIIKTIDKLAPGESDTITVTYEVKQTDVDNLEKIANIAKSEAEDGTKDSDDDTTVPTDKTPLIEVEKTATKINGNTVTKEEDGKLISTDEEGNVISRDTKVAKGDMITYTIKTTNTGKVTLKNIDVTDTLEITYNGNKIAPNTIIKTIDKLAPGESDTITVTYEVKQTDVDNLEKIANIAKSEAEDGTKDSDDDTTVPTDKTPSIDIIKEAKIIKIGATEATVKRNEEGNVITYITNAGDTIRYTITATNDSHRILENVNIYDQTHTVKVIKVQKGSYDFEPNDDANTVVAGGNLLGVLPEEHQKTLEPNESYVITIEYKVENIVNVQEIENIAIVLATAKNTGESVTDNDTEKVPVIQKIEPTIEKTSIKVGTTVINDENRNTVKLKQGDKVTYEIIVTNQGNKVLTDVAVTDDHKVTIGKIEKVNADGTRTEDTVLKRNATANNLLGKTILEPEEKYVITVSYIVTVKDTEINEEDPEKGDKLINYAYLDAKELEEKISDDDILTKYKESIITQTKTSTVIGKAENDSIVNTGDIIEYTITVSNTGNISGPTTVKDVLIKTNIENDKVVMMNGNTELNKAQSLITNCISVESNKGESTATNVNELASETGYPLSVDNGEIYTIKFRVKVGKLLPGETIVNKLENQENTNTQNDVEASITLNKELVSPQNTVIVIDLSLSMAEAVDYSGGADPMADTYEETRWYALTQALDKFLDTYMDGNNTVTIIGYNGNSTQEHELIANTTNKTAAKNSYSNILTREQFRKGDKSDVDSLSETGTKLASGTNIEAGLIKAQNILGTNINGAKVILMTDGEANRRIVNGNSVSCNTTQGINAANAQATTLKENGATLYTVSLSLGTANQEYITKLAQMASKDENGEHLSDSVENIEDLVKYFKKISESISEYHYTTTTKSGILYLSDAFSVDSRYVREIIVEIPNDETEQTITLSWSEFVTYYNSTSKTINVKQLAQDKGIKAITGNVSITINVDTVIQQ